MATRQDARETGGVKRPDKIERANAPKGAEGEPKKKSTATEEYRIRPGHSVTRGELDDEGNPVYREYVANDTVKMTAEEAATMPWAVEKAERRRERSGQNVRLQKQIEALQAQIEKFETIAKQSSDPKTRKQAQELRDEAILSIKLRGDMHALRGEPTPHVASGDTVNAADNLRDLEFVSANRDLRSDDDEVGVAGMNRSNVSTDTTARADTRSVPGREGMPSEPSQGGPEGLEDEAERQGQE